MFLAETLQLSWLSMLLALLGLALCTALTIHSVREAYMALLLSDFVILGPP